MVILAAVSSVLEAKLIGVAAVSEAPVALSMFLVSAEAKTSAGAPCWSWDTRSEEPAKLNVTVLPGWEASNFVPISVKVFLSDAAENTVSFPAGVRLVDADDEPPALDVPSPDEPHAAAERTRRVVAAAASRGSRGHRPVMTLLGGSRR